MKETSDCFRFVDCLGSLSSRDPGLILVTSSLTIKQLNDAMKKLILLYSSDTKIMTSESLQAALNSSVKNDTIIITPGLHKANSLLALQQGGELIGTLATYLARLNKTNFYAKNCDMLLL